MEELTGPRCIDTGALAGVPGARGEKGGTTVLCPPRLSLGFFGADGLKMTEDVAGRCPEKPGVKGRADLLNMLVVLAEKGSGVLGGGGKKVGLGGAKSWVGRVAGCLLGTCTPSSWMLRGMLSTFCGTGISPFTVPCCGWATEGSWGLFCAGTFSTVYFPARSLCCSNNRAPLPEASLSPFCFSSFCSESDLAFSMSR